MRRKSEASSLLQRSAWLSPICFVLFASALFGQTEPAMPPGADLRDPQVLLPLALSANSLDDPRLTPWHVKASYESFDESGKAADQGTFEEWRLSPDKSKRTYTSGNFNRAFLPQRLTHEESRLSFIFFPVARDFLDHGVADAPRGFKCGQITDVLSSGVAR